jgi:fatty-acyl-CoA synthase
MGLKIGSVPSTSSASTVYELLSRASAANPTGTAITYLEDADTLSVTRLTHAEFIERLYQMAHMFRELGVGRHDVVSIFSPSVTDALVAFFAAETVGIANPINFLLRSDEVEAMMRAVGSKVLVTLGPESPDLWSKVEHMQKLVPSLAQIVTIGAASGDAISLRTALRGRPTAPPSSDLLSAAEDVAAYFYTGGTTGFPKVAQLLHRNQAFSAEALADSWQFGSTTRALNGLPTFHVAGALLLGLTPLGRGGEVILPTVTGFRNPRVIANYWRLVESNDRWRYPNYACVAARCTDRQRRYLVLEVFYDRRDAHAGCHREVPQGALLNRGSAAVRHDRNGGIYCSMPPFRCSRSPFDRRSGCGSSNRSTRTPGRW